MALGFIAIALLIMGAVGTVNPWLADGGAALAMLLAAASLYMEIRQVRARQVAVGVPALIGKTAVARTPLAPDGFIFIAGERWRATLEDGSAAIGDRVTIVGNDGFSLRVRHEPAESRT